MIILDFDQIHFFLIPTVITVYCFCYKIIRYLFIILVSFQEINRMHPWTRGYNLPTMLPIRLPNTILASRRQQPPTPSPTEPKVQVRPLTKDSLETRQHVSTSVGYGYQTRNKVSVLDGSVLPSKFEPFPSELYGMPLEEIDNFIFDEVSETYFIFRF